MSRTIVWWHIIVAAFVPPPAPAPPEADIETDVASAARARMTRSSKDVIETAELVSRKANDRNGHAA